MKVVKFRNGKFAVRKFNLLLGFLYLQRRGPGQFYWWSSDFREKGFCDTAEEANELMADYKDKGQDYGE